MASCTAPVGIPLLSAYSLKEKCDISNSPKIFGLRKLGKIESCLKEENEICGWFFNFSM